VWWTRKRKARRLPPPEGPTLADLQRAADEAEQARIQLQQVREQAPAVETAAQHLERKLEILAVYGSELAPHPFPRSLEAVRALALVRGAAAGFGAAEAFQLLRERG
jgi:hypothetical protein